MALHFVGMGLHSEKGLTLEGLELAKTASKVYIELYTSLMPGLSLESLEKLIGKRVVTLRREDLEGKSAGKILDEASRLEVVILVPGDPFIATTHLAIYLEAVKRGYGGRVIHSASVASAVPSITGLSYYKFGRSVTVVYPEGGITSEDAYNVIKANKQLGLHTLVFLDIRKELELYMTIPEALKILLSVEERKREGVVTDRTLAIGVARVGGQEVEVKADMVKELLSYSFGPPPHVLVFPGRLHFIEAEALLLLAKAPKSLVEELTKRGEA